MTKKALITGITGQGVSYLSEFLLEKGYEVQVLSGMSPLRIWNDFLLAAGGGVHNVFI